MDGTFHLGFMLPDLLYAKFFVKHATHYHPLRRQGLQKSTV